MPVVEPRSERFDASRGELRNPFAGFTAPAPARQGVTDYKHDEVEDAPSGHDLQEQGSTTPRGATTRARGRLRGRDRPAPS